MKSMGAAEAMKEGMRRLASGVCVLSCRDEAGEPSAMTATSVTSVSDSPASLLVCVNRATNMYAALTAAKDTRFVVNLLSADHRQVSDTCAFGEQGPGRFDTGDWDCTGALPFLRDSQASFFCRLDQFSDYGTHGVFIAVIEQVQVGAASQINPLLYLNGQYGHFVLD